MTTTKKKPIVYQIYPMSFMDSNNDGLGDLKGIISKLKYIKSLGVDLIWLSPIFKTGFHDNGYDVINYYEIDKHFGTKQDLITLIKEAKKLDIGILLDMVFNHTSNDSVWFKEWLKGNPKYKDFYITKYSKKGPPNNWTSKFGGSCWTEYKPNNYYLHLFDKSQPDLNWANPEVRKALQDVLKYYVDLGIQGFRFDVINLISKNKYDNDPNKDGKQYYTDGKKVTTYLKELLSFVPSTNKNIFTVGELSSTTPQKLAEYTQRNQNLLTCAFFFKHLYLDKSPNIKFDYHKPDFKLFFDHIKKWYLLVNNKNGCMASVLNNHDQPRSLSRFIQEPKFYKVGAKMLFGFMSSLDGIPFIYQGEEIGMLNPWFENIKDYRDTESITYIKSKKLTKPTIGLQHLSRDNARTPMQWNSTQYAGFSKHKPWIKTAPSYKECNVVNQEKDPDSILNFYRKFISLLKTNNVLSYGNSNFFTFKNNVISFKRIYQNKSLLIIASFNGKTIKYNFDSKKIICNNYHETKLNTLLPYQFLIVQE